MSMTANEKLIRLVEIEHEIITAELLAERRRILADVHLPPAYLGNGAAPITWAYEFREVAPSVSEPVALAWFGFAIDTARKTGYTLGQTDGRLAAEGRLQQAQQGLVDGLLLVVRMLDRREARGNLVRNGSDPDSPPVPLREHLASVLRAAGVDAPQP